MPKKVLFTIIFIMMLICMGMGVWWGNLIWGDDNANIAPAYALDSCTIDTSRVGATSICYPDVGDFPNFWQEVTKNTQFTVNDKPVEITDIRVYYKYWDYNPYNGPPIYCPPPRLFYGNITFYPLGIWDSQTYVAPTPTPECYPAFYGAYWCCVENGNVHCRASGESHIIDIPIPTPCQSWELPLSNNSWIGNITIKEFIPCPTPTPSCVVTIIDKDIMEIPCPAAAIASFYAIL